MGRPRGRVRRGGRPHDRPARLHRHRGTPTTPCWSDGDAALIRLADELHDTNTVSDELWAELTGRYTDQQLLELIVTAGWYRTLAYVINAARIPLEPWAARFPAS